MPKPSRAETRRDQPVEIHQPHHQNEHRDRCQQFEIAFQIAREQEREGQREVADHQQQPDKLPAVIQAREIPGNFFRQIARPDDQELGERKVRPHHHQGEQELAEIVQVAVRQHFRHRTLPVQQHHQGDQEGHRGQPLVDHEEHAEDGGEPLGIHREDPIERHEGDAEAPEQKAGTGHAAHLAVHHVVAFADLP